MCSGLGYLLGGLFSLFCRNLSIDFGMLNCVGLEVNLFVLILVLISVSVRLLIILDVGVILISLFNIWLVFV